MRQQSKLRLALRRDLRTTFESRAIVRTWSTRSSLWARDLVAHAMKGCSMKRKSTIYGIPSSRATRGQGRTDGDRRTWWRGLRIADRRKTSTFRLLVQVYLDFALLPASFAKIPSPFSQSSRRE